MLSKIASGLIPVIILGVLVHEVLNTPFYGEGELTKAREETVALAEQGNFDEAFERFKALTDIAPRDQKVWADYITVLIWSGQDEKALTLADEKLDYQQAPVYVLDRLFDVAMKQEDYARAEQLALAAMPNAEQPVDYAIGKSRRMLARQQSESARRILNTSLQDSANNAELQAELRLIDMLADPQQQALVRERLAQRDPGDTLNRTLIEAAIIRARGGEYQQSVLDLQAAHERDPSDQQLASDYLVVLSWAGDFAASAAIYEQLKTPPTDPYVQEAAAESLLQIWRLNEAKILYGQLYSEFPDNQRYVRGMARVEAASGNSDAAIAILDGAVENGTANEQTLEILAYLYDSLGYSAQAADTFSLLFTLRPEGNRPYLVWFDNIERAIVEQPDEKYFDQLGRWLPGQASEDVVSRYLVLLAKTGRRDQAQLLASSGLANKRLDKHIGWEAKTLRNNAQRDEAVEAYRFGRVVYPQNISIALGEAIVLSEAGRAGEADALFADLVARYPSNEAILNAAIYHNRRFGRDRQTLVLLERLMPLSQQREPLLASWMPIVLSDSVYQSDQQRLQALDRISGWYPQSNRWWHARSLLLSQQQRCPEAMEALGQINYRWANQQMMDSAGYIARQCQQFERAERYYAMGLERYPDNGNFVAGLALVQVDAGDSQAALATLDQYPQFAKNKSYLYAQGYAYNAAQDYPEAVAVYRQYLERWPDDQQVTVDYVMALGRMGESDQSIALAEQHPDWFSADHWRILYADRITFQIRAAMGDDISANERNALLAQAQLNLDNYIIFLQENFPAEQEYIQQAREDQLVAYYAAGDMPAVLSTYGAMGLGAEQSSVDMLNTVADAHLHMQQAGQAVPLLEVALEKEPDNERSQLLLFYAYQDAGENDKAEALLAVIVAGQGDEPPARDAAHWQAELAAIHALNTNRLESAQQQLEHLLVASPDDPDLLLALARLYRWRGWSEKAQQQYQLALQKHPSLVAAKVGSTYSHLDRHYYSEANQQVDALESEHGELPEVADLLENWQLHNSYELDSRLQYGRSSGSAFASEDFYWDTHFYSKPIDEHFRAYGRHYYSWAELPWDEGSGRLNRLGAGVEYRADTVEVKAEANASIINDSDPGLTVAGNWRIDDHWLVAGLLQTYSLEVPLRAIKSGVDGSSLGVSAQYRWHDRHHLTAGYDTVDFSDGNLRQSIYASHYHQLYSNRNHSFALIESIYHSRNSEDDDRLYFNPESDVSVGLTGEYLGLIRNTYSYAWNHRLSVGAGVYEQKNYSGHFIWDVDYQQSWQFGKAFSVNYGLLHKYRVYDGDGEGYTALYGGINWRF